MMDEQTTVNEETTQEAAGGQENEDLRQFANLLLMYGQLIIKLTERVDKLEQRERESQARWVLYNTAKPPTARDN